MNFSILSFYILACLTLVASSIDSSSTSTYTALHQEVLGTEVVHAAVAKPAGVLLLFHGCQHSAIDWWPVQSSCQACIGLPEEVRITRAAAAHNLVAVALSSKDRLAHRCWDATWPVDQSSEIQQVGKVVQQLVKKEGWTKLPLYALGVSSGGALALLLASYMPLQGVCSQVMAIPPAWLDLQNQAKREWPHPPTIFMHMSENDPMTAAGVAQDLKALLAAGVRAAEIKVLPQPVTKGFLSGRIDNLDARTAAEIVEALKAEGMLNPAGFLLQDPRQTSKRWHKILREAVPVTQQMNLNHDESPIHEELNIAWAGHECISDEIADVFKFFHHKAGG
ncbi:hypothetical protein WJX84_001804 [Apatococcus fuscideae]|uniref:Esterase n=1 Tax=Apatococcus fuscideae TaxID=2026836 RepID=A0AAW1SY06_9CHLO